MNFKFYLAHREGAVVTNVDNHVEAENWEGIKPAHFWFHWVDAFFKEDERGSLLDLYNAIEYVIQIGGFPK